MTTERRQKATTTDDRSARVGRNLELYGYSPVRWSHHPKRVKDAIRSANLRPMAKQCFSNSQRLVLLSDDNGIGYVEGIVIVHGVPIHHGWNTLDGEPFDVTLEVLPPVAVSIAHSPSDAVDVIRHSTRTTGYWQAMHGARLWQMLMQKNEVRHGS